MKCAVPMTYLACELVKHVYLIDFSITSDHPFHNIPQPGRTLSAWCALSTALITVYVRNQLRWE